MKSCCHKCKYFISIYKREYKGVVIGCSNNTSIDFRTCYAPKEDYKNKKSKKEEGK